MSRLTRDGTAEPISRDQILRHARGQGNIIFPVQLTTSRIGNLTRLIHTLLYVMTIHTYIHTYIHTTLRCQYYMLQLTFDFLYLTEGKKKQKIGERSFYKNKKQKNRARRVVEVRLRRFAVQTN